MEIALDQSITFHKVIAEQLHSKTVYAHGRRQLNSSILIISTYEESLSLMVCFFQEMSFSEDLRDKTWQ